MIGLALNKHEKVSEKCPDPHDLIVRICGGAFHKTVRLQK
jgi:hypothetical protein